MKLYAKRIFALAFSLCLFGTFGLCVSAAAEEVRVPMKMQIPEAIAGAEFEVSYTSGLKLLSYEKSEAVRSAATTPIVEKNGNTYFGFYTGTNAFAPENGVLDVGFLVFEYNGEPGQSVTVSEAKYVMVIDKDHTKSEVLIIKEEIGVPLVGDGLMIGKKSYTGWVVGGASVVVLGAAAALLYRKKLLAAKALQAASVGAADSVEAAVAAVDAVETAPAAVETAPAAVETAEATEAVKPAEPVEEAAAPVEPVEAAEPAETAEAVESTETNE